MKKLILFTFLVTSLSSLALSSAGDLFSYNPETVSGSLEPLQRIENYIYSHPGTELTDLINDQSDLITGLNLSPSSCGGIEAAMDGDPLIGIPPYYWGCCLGIPGWIYVLAVSDDTYQRNRAFWGCFYHYDLWLTFWLIWYYLGYY
jgi:hypothetical protein